MAFFPAREPAPSVWRRVTRITPTGRLVDRDPPCSGRLTRYSESARCPPLARASTTIPEYVRLEHGQVCLRILVRAGAKAGFAG